MLKAEETSGGPLSVKQLNTVLVFIAIRYSDYCKLYYYYNKYFFFNNCIWRQERISSLGPVNL